MTTLTKSMKKRIMRRVVQITFEKHFDSLASEAKQYNKDVIALIQSHHTDVVAKEVKKSTGHDILLSETSSPVKIRIKGKKPVELRIFHDVPYIMKANRIYYAGDIKKGQILPSDYVFLNSYGGLDSVIYEESSNPFTVIDWSRIFEIVCEWDSSDRYNRRPYFTLPEVQGNPTLPAEEVKKLNDRYNKLKARTNDLITSLHTINSLLFSAKSDKMLHDVWPEGKSIVNHVIVSSQNTLPVAMVRKATTNIGIL